MPRQFRPLLVASLVGIVLLSAPAAFARPAPTDVVFAVVAKQVEYQQTSSADQALAVSGENGAPYSFMAMALESSTDPHSLAAGAVSRGTDAFISALTPPNTQFKDNFATQAELDAAYPDGDYSLWALGWNDGFHQSRALNLTGTYPTAPFVTNFDELQTIDPTQAVTVHWNAIAGGSMSDNILVQIWANDNTMVFSSPMPKTGGALDGTATSLTIPADMLPTGQSLNLNVTFVKMVDADLDSYPGVPLVAAFVANNDMMINTPEPAAMSILVMGAIGMLARRRRA
jgi:hypothetical protein